MSSSVTSTSTNTTWQEPTGAEAARLQEERKHRAPTPGDEALRKAVQAARKVLEATSTAATVVKQTYEGNTTNAEFTGHLSKLYLNAMETSRRAMIAQAEEDDRKSLVHRLSNHAPGK